MGALSVGTSSVSADWISMNKTYKVFYGTTKVDLKDSTGHVYRKGTRAAGDRKSEYGVSFAIMQNMPISSYFGLVPGQSVTPTTSKVIHVPKGFGQKFLNVSYITDAGRYETLNPVKKTAAPKKKVAPKKVVKKKTTKKIAPTMPKIKAYEANQARRNDGLYTGEPYGYKGSKFAGRMPKGTFVWIEKQIVDKNNSVLYYGTVHGKKFWFDAKVVKVAMGRA